MLAFCVFLTQDSKESSVQIQRTKHHLVEVKNTSKMKNWSYQFTVSDHCKFNSKIVKEVTYLGRGWCIGLISCW